MLASLRVQGVSALNGQLLNGTFMDYHLPTSLDVPRIETGHAETLRRSTRWE